MANYHVTGLDQVRILFEEVGNAPAKVLTASTRAGASIALKYAKAHVPVGVEWTTGQYAHEPGTLKKSLRIKKEKNKKGKSVYTIGPNKTGWYAHFLDYGHWATGGKRLSTSEKTRNAQTTGMTWVPGNRFLRDSVDRNRATIKQTILSVMARELNKLR